MALKKVKRPYNPEPEPQEELQEEPKEGLNDELQDEPAEEADLGDFQPSNSNGKNTDKAGPGVLSIINSKKNGKRIVFSKALTEELGHPESVQFAFKDDEIAIGKALPDNDKCFAVKKYGARGVIYSADLIQEITERYELNFMGTVSKTLQEVRYLTYDGRKIAIITV